MPVGDVITVAPTSIAAGSSLTIQPGSGIEWIIHNIYVDVASTIELYRTDGTNPIKFDANTGCYMGFYFHLTNAQYMTIKNTGASAIYISYDGVISKVI